jgi:parallel beta-helix repeat protein
MCPRSREWNMEVKRFATPLFEKNRISGAHMGGVYCHGGGGIGAFTSDFTNRDSAITRFTLTNNDIFANKGVGVSIGNDGVPAITHNRFYGGQNAAIYVAGVKAQGTITDNEMYENKDGIVLREGACPHIERNIIRDQKRRGVVVCARGQGFLIENTISGSGWYNVEVTRRAEACIACIADLSTTDRRCVACSRQVRGEKPKEISPEKAEKELEKKKRLYASMGLLVPLPKDGVTIAGLITDESGKTSVLLRGNRIVGGGRGGVHLCEWARGVLKKNEMIQASGPALVVATGADPEVDGNTISECATFGIHVLAGGMGRYANNKISMNASSGFCLETDASSDVRANELCENDDAGMLVKAGANARIYGNTMHSNGGAGIEVEGEGTTQLRDNDVHSNKGAGGIIVRAACEVTVCENNVHENDAAGVLLLEGANPLLAKNRLVENGGEGVRMMRGAKGRLERNTIQGNVGAGILSEPDCTPTIGENFVTNNADEKGVALDDAAVEAN